MDIVDRAAEAAGGSGALARGLGLSKSVIGNWRRRGGIPPAQVPRVSKLTGIPMHELRPDIYEPPEPSAALLDSEKVA